MATELDTPTDHHNRAEVEPSANLATLSPSDRNDASASPADENAVQLED